VPVMRHRRINAMSLIVIVVRVAAAKPGPVGGIRGLVGRFICRGLLAFHVWMATAWQEIIWRAAQRSLAVMCPAC
jgi:hypothetical protein